MDIVLRVDDDLVATYREEAVERNTTIGEVMRERLTRAVGLDPRDRGVIITGGQTLHQIEFHLGGGDLKDAEDLLRKVRKLASVRMKAPNIGDSGEAFGDRYFALSPVQLQELVFRAEKTGRSIEELFEEIWRRVSEDFFRYVP